MWLQPLAEIVLLSGVILFSSLNRIWRRVGVFIGVAFLFAVVMVNLSWAVPSSMHPSKCLGSAEWVKTVVSPGDLVVTDWDETSTLYQAFYSEGVRLVSFPTKAGELGPAVYAHLDAEVRSVQLRGGRVFFLGILDQTRENWDSFLGTRAGVPYEALDRYRAQSVIIAAFECKGTHLSLRRLQD